MTDPIWTWRQSGRSWTLVVLLGVIWAAVLLAVFWINLAFWIAALLLLATIPGVWDVARGRALSLSVTPDRLIWQSGARTGEVALTARTQVSLRRRFDGGLRIVVTDAEGRQTRLPPELAPPIDPLEAALSQSPAEIRRDPFRLI